MVLYRVVSQHVFIQDCPHSSLMLRPSWSHLDPGKTNSYHGFPQDCDNYSAFAMEFPQSCAKTSIWSFSNQWFLFLQFVSGKTPLISCCNEISDIFYVYNLHWKSVFHNLVICNNVCFIMLLLLLWNGKFIIFLHDLVIFVVFFFINCVIIIS